MKDRIKLTVRDFKRTDNHLTVDESGEEVIHKALIIDVGDISEQERDNLVKQILEDIEKPESISEILESKIPEFDEVQALKGQVFNLNKKLGDTENNLNAQILSRNCYRIEGERLKASYGFVFGKLKEIDELCHNIDVKELDAQAIDILNEIKTILVK